MPITAGVLDILNGAFGIILGLLFLALGSATGFYGTIHEFYEVWGPLHIILGALAIAGGIIAFKRKWWCLALAGSIFAIPPVALWMYSYWSSFYPSHFSLLPMLQGFSIVPAIFAIVLTVLSRKQFKGKQAAG